ncbi:MAG: nucleoside triphosphate pyrophosphohydrolase [Bacteroidetes bacterium]|nr:MAG: nucleoside triphosphate pyrophosphohydrolase [Bacteroidota bacterium]
MPTAPESFARLMEIVDELRAQCPWDRKQTKESIRHLTIEETYELSDTILAGDYPEMKIELGDLLMHMIFYASLARDAGQFDMGEVLETQIEKLIRRHPHIYGDLVGASEAEIHANWEKIKAAEKAAAGKERASVFDGVPASLPSLIKAQRLQEKAAAMGFDFSDAADALSKVEEEWDELEHATDADHQAEEMGDLLFALVNYCRHLGINAEDALARSSQKFQRRFSYLEHAAWDQGKNLSDLSTSEADALWEEAKKRLR